jgi:tripartite ATP-independent transporter DctP family solute receptor
MKQGLAAALVGAALVALPGTAEAQQRVLKYGHVYETSHPMHAASVAAAEHMQKCTGNAIKVDIFPASQLGSEVALNEQIRFGGVDIILTGQLFAAQSYKPIAIGAAPYIFRDRDHALAYRTSDVLKDLMAEYNKITGQHMMSAGYFGAFNVSSNKSIVKPEDMRGLKIRVPNVPLYMAFPRAVGANPTPVAFAEVYLALKQGVVEASVNPLPVTYAFKFYEVQKYVALTGHLVEYAMLIFGDPAWKQLNEAQRKCAQEMADVYADQSSKAIVDQENSLRAEMTSKNLIQFTDPDKAAFQAASAGVIDELIREGQFSRQLVERVRAVR